MFNARHHPSPSLDSILAGSDVIQPSESVKNIGFFVFIVLAMDKKIKNVSKSAFYHLRIIFHRYFLQTLCDLDTCFYIF